MSLNDRCRNVYLIGLDGASPELVLSYTARGLLPTIGQLLREGLYGRLVSTLPPVSAPAWSSLVTGVGPGKHGIFGFRGRILGTYDVRLLNGQDRVGRPVWRILSERGFQVGVLNVPLTYPPEPVSGFLVSGMDTPGGRVCYTYPAELMHALKTALGEYLIELPLFSEARRGDHEGIYRKIMRNLRNRIAAVRYLWATYRPQFFVVNFRETDSIQHYFWDDPYGRVLRVYQELDDFLGWLIGQLPEDTLLLVLSDHGFGPAGRRAVLLNRWLVQNGYIKIKRVSTASKLLGERAIAWLRACTPAMIRRLAQRVWPLGFERARIAPFYFLADWTSTRAYADEQQGMVWLNVAGREPYGVVTPGKEYDALVEEIRDSLSALCDPLTGVRVFKGVYRREELYAGPMLERAPDLLVVPNDDPPYRLATSPLASTGDVVLPVEQTCGGFSVFQGTHRQHGLLIAWGNMVKKGDGPLEAQVTDITPTVLYAFDCPIPPGLDGRPLTEILTFQRSPAYEDAAEGDMLAGVDDLRAREDDNTVLNRLRGLGYID